MTSATPPRSSPWPKQLRHPGRGDRQAGRDAPERQPDHDHRPADKRDAGPERVLARRPGRRVPLHAGQHAGDVDSDSRVGRRRTADRPCAELPGLRPALSRLREGGGDAAHPRPGHASGALLRMVLEQDARPAAPSAARRYSCRFPAGFAVLAPVVTRSERWIRRDE